MFSRPQAEGSTSWGNVADWYNSMLETGPGTYQYDVILPALLRLIAPKKDMQILDLACGNGFFSRAFAEAGATVEGVDISRELIEHAKKKTGILPISYVVSSAEKIPFIKNASKDIVVIVLALQNIQKPELVIEECSRILKPGGKLYIVLNHPAFRIPKSSSWEYDEARDIEYRRIDAYMSEARYDIEMHPGDNPNVKTVSFHRPLQYFFKLFGKHHFAVTRLEEWMSNREGPRGKRARSNDRARKEIPLFLCLEILRLP
jgi:ubiquinone/menaquinone biosynthesis C-methylase UbiE